MKKIAIFIFMLIGMFPVLAKAENATLKEEYLKGIYYVVEAKDGTISQNQQPIFRLNGKIAYCLEPEVPAKAGEYQVTKGLSGSYLSKEERKKVEEFGYYGYEYPGHQRKEYYLAAQELIWETVGSYEAKWVTSLSEKEEIDVEKEKLEILKLIEENKKLPSFHLNTVYIYEEEFLELYDQNQVVENFQLIDSHFRIINGKLIGQGATENVTLKGKLRTYDKEETLLYRQENSQKMATLRLTDPAFFELSVVIEGISMKIHKTGEVWNGIRNTGEWENQSGVEFELYAEEDIMGHVDNILYEKGTLIEKLITKKGYAETKKLPNGKYRLVETKAKDGYTYSSPIIFEINSSVEKDFIIEIKNELSTGKLEILKTDEQKQPLSGVVFGLYSKNGRKLDEQITNQEGKIIWDRLPVGEYQVRELKTLEGYVLNTEKEKIDIKENQTFLVEKVNVPLLPNTSGKKYPLEIMFGLLGLVISKQFLR